MRKTFVILLIAMTACMALFAHEDTYMTAGVFQSVAATSATFSFNWNRLEAEAGIGFPMLTTLGIGGKNIYYEEDGGTRIDSALSHPVLSLSATFAVLDWQADSFEAFLRVGLATDIAFAFRGGFRMVGSYGLAVGMDMLFGSFRFGIQACAPASNILMLAKQDVRKGYYQIGSSAYDGVYETLSSVAWSTESVRISAKYAFGGF